MMNDTSSPYSGMSSGDIMISEHNALALSNPNGQASPGSILVERDVDRHPPTCTFSPLTLFEFGLNVFPFRHRDRVRVFQLDHDSYYSDSTEPVRLDMYQIADDQDVEWWPEPPSALTISGLDFVRYFYDWSPSHVACEIVRTQTDGRIISVQIDSWDDDEVRIVTTSRSLAESIACRALATLSATIVANSLTPRPERMPSPLMELRQFFDRARFWRQEGELSVTPTQSIITFAGFDQRPSRFSSRELSVEQHSLAFVYITNQWILADDG